jgi:hypothetical protein
MAQIARKAENASGNLFRLRNIPDKEVEAGCIANLLGKFVKNIDSKN